MSVSHRPTSRDAGTAAPTRSEPTNPYAEIVALAESAPSPHVYFRKAFRTIAAAFASPYAAVYVRHGTDVTEDDWHTGPTDPGFWKPNVQHFLTESLTEGKARATLLHSKQGRVMLALLFAPIAALGEGGIALVASCTGKRDAAGRLTMLESLVNLTAYAAVLPRERPAERPPSSAGSDASNQAFARAGAAGTLEELAFAITNNLRNKLGCEQVAIGLILHRRVKILSISGLDHIVRQSSGVVHLRAAMEECLDAGRPIVCQSEKDWEAGGFSTGHRLHKQWHAAAARDAVASIPLRSGDEVAAVLSLRRRSDQPFNGKLIEEIHQRVAPFAPALHLARRASRGLFRHTFDNVQEGLRRLVGPGCHGTKAAAAIVAVFLAWFVFGSVDYHLTVPCAVVPAHVRHVTVPFDGMLVAARVVEGDPVQQGDVLAEMDRRDLEQEQAALVAQLAVLERRQDRARADQSPVDVQLALAEATLVQAKLDIVDRRLKQAVIRAPIDGLTISGDLRAGIGSIFARGDPLFAVAEREGWTIEMQVPEADVDELAVGLTGTFAPLARPEQSQPLRVTRIRPKADIRSGGNVYIAEATCDLPFAWMQPEMEGTAKVRVGRRPVWWVALHRAIDFVRLNLWL